MSDNRQKTSFFSSIWNSLWDIWCIISVIGIWPRFIEPKLLSTTRLNINLPDLPFSFDGFKILFFSDLHISNLTSQRFLKKVISRIRDESPNLILLGGDFLNYSRTDDLAILSSFLKNLSCSHGIYTCLGNHDYKEYVTINENSQFVIGTSKKTSILSGFKRLFGKEKSASQIETTISKPIEHIPELLSLLKACRITVLENEITTIFHEGGRLQIAGIGDIMAGRAMPQKAFTKWDPTIPGIVLSHNPDSWPILSAYPGNLYLFGHTHGGQVNLPWMWRKLTPIINTKLKRGLFYEYGSRPGSEEKILYISRGIGSTFPFRWFSIPEIVSITLNKAGPAREKVHGMKHAFTSYAPSLQNATSSSYSYSEQKDTTE